MSLSNGLNMDFKKNLQFFKTGGIEILRSYTRKEFCLLDEIGGIELFVPEFMEEVLCCLDSQVPCIGVMKSRKNLEAMRTRVPTEPDPDKLLRDLEEKLVKRSNGRILTFEREKKENTFRRKLWNF